VTSWSPPGGTASGRIVTVPRPVNPLRWAERSPIERVRLYTVGSLYVLFVFFMVLMLVSAMATLPEPLLDAFAVGLTGVLVAGGLLALRAILGDDGPRAPGRLAGGLLVGGAVAGQGVAWTLPSESGFSLSLLVVCALAWGLGGVDDVRVWRAVVALSPVLAWTTSRDLGFTAYAAGMAAFLVFTVRSSLWLLGVVEELETGRRTGAALAVAEERLRFSRDVHDVLGRRLSEIAVQAELAGAYVARGDERAAGTLGDVRTTAHTALREARELARGYRPVDLAHELEGARSLLRSAGIESRAALDGLPGAWTEPVARVVREAVTNVLRHSRATLVTMSYDDGVVVVRNDGVSGAAAGGGHGLLGLGELVAPLGARIETARDGEWFELRVVPGERA
jgi:two-component system sensor histidine kinase DesK